MISRDNIIDELVPYFDADRRLWLLICDCGFAKVDRFKAKHCDRMVNMGIAEQSTVGIAAGMAQAGLIPIIFSIASFIVFRALEQIKIDVVDMNRNVKIIGQGSGNFFKDMGRCHCCGDNDVSLMEIAGMPVYDAEMFNRWIESRKGGYIRV